MTVKNVKKNIKNIKTGIAIGLYPPAWQPFLLNEYTFFFKFFLGGRGQHQVRPPESAPDYLYILQS